MLDEAKSRFHALLGETNIRWTGAWLWRYALHGVAEIQSYFSTHAGRASVPSLYLWFKYSIMISQVPPRLVLNSQLAIWLPSIPCQLAC